MTRLDELVEESHALVDQAIAAHTGDPHVLVGTVILYSGGNDSTVLAHLMKGRATHAAHANTGIGIEATRQFVRDTCEGWGLPLIEKHPPVPYRDLVLAQGFPGPGMHWKMYQRLKERCLRQVRGELVTNPRRERVLFLAGRRRSESKRRMQVPDMERDGSVIWCSPLVNWTALDLNAYRKEHPDCPTNEVTAMMHMSGECLCGSFAAPGERAELAMWYPEVDAEIAALEKEVAAARPDLPDYRCMWGWGAEPEHLKKSRASNRVGMLCSSCDARRGLLEEQYA